MNSYCGSCKIKTDHYGKPPRSIPTVTLLFIIIVCSSPAGGETSDFYRGLRLRASPCGRGGLWPPTIWYRFAHAAYILPCVRLSPSSPLPPTLFPPPYPPPPPSPPPPPPPPPPP